MTGYLNFDGSSPLGKFYMKSKLFLNLNWDTSAHAW